MMRHVRWRWVLLGVFVGALLGCGGMEGDCDALAPQKIRTYDAAAVGCEPSPT